MKTRPWPIVILAVLQILSPIVSVLLSAHQLHTPPWQFTIMLMKYGTWMQIFDVFVSCIIAGAAIFAVKNWSYPVFLAISGWGVYSNIDVWSQYRQVYSLATLVSVNVVNLSLVSYFLIPAVSAAYFNPRLRWWESKPRYRVDFDATIMAEPKEADGSKLVDCTISDISEGGVFLHAKESLKIGGEVTLNFMIHHLKFAVRSRVVHQGRPETFGYGVQFVELSRDEARALRDGVHGLDLLNYDRRDPEINWLQDFKAWYMHLFKTGEGLVPSVPKPRTKLQAIPATDVEATASADDESKAA